MWDKTEYFIKGQNDGIYYFPYDNSYLKIKVKSFNDDDELPFQKPMHLYR